MQRLHARGSCVNSICVVCVSVFVRVRACVWLSLHAKRWRFNTCTASAYVPYPTCSPACLARPVADQIKNRHQKPTPGGWRDIMMSVRFMGFIFEIQIAHKLLIQCRKGGGTCLAILPHAVYCIVLHYCLRARSAGCSWRKSAVQATVWAALIAARR